ncbi:MAG: hypothetical protein QM724_05855 [Flavobacteriales bacterium]
MRIHFLYLSLGLALFASAQGPYSVLLASGDSLTGKEYYFKGDSLGIVGARKVACRDILLFQSRREKWTFTAMDGTQVKLKGEGVDSCARGYACAERYAASGMPFDLLPMPESWRNDPLLLDCYRDRLEEHGILTDENGDRDTRVVMGGHGGVAPGHRDEVIKLTGDTICLDHYTYHKDSLLCWYNGPCMPIADILLIRTPKGQFYFTLHGRRESRLRKPVLDLSPPSLGRLYAHRLFGCCLEWSEAPIPDTLKNDPAFLRSYRAEVLMLVDAATKRKRRNDALSVVSGGLGGAAINGAVGATIQVGLTAAFIKPENRPFWGTPMPEGSKPPSDR